MIAGTTPLFITVRWLDIVDILLVAFLIYQLYRIVRGTVAIRIFAGILSIYLFWKIVEALKMDLLGEILGQFIGVGVIALIIVFQQELRRFLILIGTTGFWSDKTAAKRLFSWKWKGEKSTTTNISEIVKACAVMSKKRTGALIILEKGMSLQFYESSGEELNAKLSQDLIECIFFKNNPLHDGAITISNDRIQAARCVLPVSEKKDLPSSLGMRHRAALGISEVSDAIAIAVSEQTGDISMASSGEIKTGLTTEQLKQLLKQQMA